MSDPVVRIAAKGDGVTASGQHVAFAVPGDCLDGSGTLVWGPQHIVPPCRHFPECGGCQLQHADDKALARFVCERVAYAAEGQGLSACELLPTHLSPPRSRRRASLHGLRTNAGAVVGFREGASHRIVDMRECHVLRPELWAMVSPLREIVSRFGGRNGVEISLALTGQGVDCGLKGLDIQGLEATEQLQKFAENQQLARLTRDDGYGPDAVWEPEPVTVRVGGVALDYPAGAFLQATAEAEAQMIEDAKSYLQGAEIIADLFSGIGTFAFAMPAGTRVLAAEAARDLHRACNGTAKRLQRRVHALHRDLFRNPLQPEELNRFDAVLIDPPRAGARDQVARIAASTVPRVVYVSCNPASWARDARVLVDAGYRLETLRPVGQFRWSTHVELISLFTRAGGG